MMQRLQKIELQRPRRSAPATLLAMLALVNFFANGGTAWAQSGSVLINAVEERLRESHSATAPSGRSTEEMNEANASLHAWSLFTIGLPEPTEWHKHDLVQVLIRETSNISSTQELSTEKNTEISGEVKSLPLDGLEHFVLNQAQIGAVDLRSDRTFDGTGEYDREDDFSARLTARVVDVLPNGHLVIEARTYIETDDEESSLKLSGICDPARISPAGTILSGDIFDLRVVKDHEGELRKANEKGIFTKVIEAIFAF